MNVIHDTDYFKFKQKTILLLIVVITLFLLTSCTNESLNQEYDWEEYGYIVVYCRASSGDYSPSTSTEGAISSCPGHRLSLRNLRIYERDIPDEYSNTLDVMFGDEWEIFSMEERWGGAFFLCHHMHLSSPHQYLRWTIEYQDGDGVIRHFTFNNRQNFHFHVTRHIKEMISQHYKYYFYDEYMSDFATGGRISFYSARIPMAECYVNPTPYAGADDPLWLHQAEAFRNGLETPEGAISLTQISPSNVFEHMPIFLSTLIPVYRNCLCLERAEDELCPRDRFNDMINEIKRFTDYNLNIWFRLRFTGCDECREIVVFYLQGTAIYTVNDFHEMSEQVVEMFFDDITERIQSTPPEPLSWEVALEEYLEQFPPIFHHPEYIENDWGNNWWRSDWHDFIEFLVDEQGNNIGDIEAHRYGITYRFRNPITDEILDIDETPFLHQHSWIWTDDEGDEHQGSNTWVATGFQLFDLDDTGIPALVIYWYPSVRAISSMPGQRLTLHLYDDDSFEFVEELSHWEGIGFFRDEEGRVFLDYRSTVAHMVDLRLMTLGDEIIIEPILSTRGYQPVMVYNHLTGEYTAAPYSNGGWFPRWRGDDDVYDEKLGLLLTRIEPHSDLVNQLMETISGRIHWQPEI